ncbi:MAG TPA: OmpH family outer membrane protein [Puia sp.]|jgi:outer membrane protein|nr:OmpH family outer membrane protein [Puia sp.]
MKSLRLNLISITSLLIAVFLLLYFFAFANNKIVYVDSAKLLNGYKAMIEARKEFDKKRNAWQANIDTLTRDVQDAIKKYSKDLSLGTEKEKQLSKELISAKQKALIDYQSVVRQNAAQEEDRLNQEVFSTVNTFLLRYGKKHGYKMILIASNGNIAYADPSMEITDRIVEELNKEYSVPVK